MKKYTTEEMNEQLEIQLKDKCLAFMTEQSEHNIKPKNYNFEIISCEFNKIKRAYKDYLDVIYETEAYDLNSIYAYYNKAEFLVVKFTKQLLFDKFNYYKDQEELIEKYN